MRNAPYSTTRTISYPMDAAFAASTAAYRINGDRYIKMATEGVVEGPRQRPNREIMIEALTTNPELVIDADRERGQEVRRYFRRVVFAMLSGQQVTSYQRTVADFIDNDTTRSALEIGVIASLPDAFVRGLSQMEVKQRIAFARGGQVGTFGSRLEITVEVLQTFYSQQWGCYYITGITPNDQVVRWSATRWTATKFATIRGTVKSYSENTTKLGRVKVVTSVKKESA